MLMVQQPECFTIQLLKNCIDGEKGINVIPCFYKMTYPEWAPFDRSEGRPVHPDRGPEIMAQTTKQWY